MSVEPARTRTLGTRVESQTTLAPPAVRAPQGRDIWALPEARAGLPAERRPLKPRPDRPQQHRIVRLPRVERATSLAEPKASPAELMREIGDLTGVAVVARTQAPRGATAASLEAQRASGQILGFERQGSGFVVFTRKDATVFARDVRARLDGPERTGLSRDARADVMRALGSPKGLSAMEPQLRAMTAAELEEQLRGPNETPQQQLIGRLRVTGWAITQQDPTHAARARGRVYGYPQAVNVFVPPRYTKSPEGDTVHFHLHGHIIGSTIESSVFARTRFAQHLAESGTTGLLIAPESTGHDDTFREQWMGPTRRKGTPRGAAAFDAFAATMERTLDMRIGSASLSTHSGSGFIGDSLVSNSRVPFRYRAHFDDGYGTTGWPARRSADDKIYDAGGWVFAIGVAGSEGSTHMNAAAWNRRTGRDPSFVSTSWTDGNGRKHTNWYVRSNQRVPVVDYATMPARAAERRVENEVRGADAASNPDAEGSAHFGVMGLLPSFWAVTAP